MVGVATIVAEKQGIVAPIVRGDIDVAVVVEIGGSQSATSNRAAEVGSEGAVGNFFKLTFT